MRPNAPPSTPRSNSQIRQGIADAIDDTILLFPPAVSIETYEAVDETIAKLAEITNEFLAVKYRHCAKYVCELIAELFAKLRTRSNLVEP